MKKIEIICIGKIKENYLTDAIAEYTKRLGRFCDFKIIELKEFSDNELSIKKESDLILSKLDGVSILLDINGELVTSDKIAQDLDKAFTSGAQKLQFIIGGSRGVSSEVKAKAQKSYSFGRITYPHQLMRVVVLEQIYRAVNILAGTPYHK